MKVFKQEKEQEIGTLRESEVKSGALLPKFVPSCAFFRHETSSHHNNIRRLFIVSPELNSLNSQLSLLNTSLILETSPSSTVTLLQPRNIALTSIRVLHRHEDHV